MLLFISKSLGGGIIYYGEAKFFYMHPCLAYKFVPFCSFSYKSVFFAPCKKKPTNFESSWLKNFALHKVEVFIISKDKGHEALL
jgi:hypothetical protein